MCGRYTLRATPQQLMEIFEVTRSFEHQPRYNIAPTQLNPVIRLIDDERQIDSLRWGLIPSWAKDAKIGYKMINARSEEIAKSFKPALKSRRCLVLTDGWYEWKAKQPYHFRFPDNEPFAFAGLWERWQDTESFTIFTTESVGTAANYHNRMPVILPKDAYKVWLDPDIDGNELVEPLLKPWEEEIEVQQANSCVGNVKNETPECLSQKD